MHLFTDMMTQWRVGPGGPIGLDYAAVPAVLRMRQRARASWSELFDDLRIMEREALLIMRESQ